MAEYDVTEAKKHLDRFVGSLVHADRYAAATKLRKAVKELFAAAMDLPITVERCSQGLEQDLVAVNNSPVASLFFTSDGILIRREGGTAKAEHLPIAYDPDSQLFVGTEEDTGLHPMPGTPKTRRNAVTVIADEILAMAKSTAPR
jgi:hypothetical protein